MLNMFDNSDAGKLILRLTVGGLMLFHGIAKITNPGTVDYIAGSLGGYGIPGFVAYGVYIGEVVAPIMLIAGLYCRLGALLIVINMLFAIVLMHSGDLFSLTEHGGWGLELQGFYLFGALAILTLGSGNYGINKE